MSRTLALLRDLLGELGLELKAEKTRIVHLREGGEGLEFLGFEHRWVRAKRNKDVQFLARWPSRRERCSGRVTVSVNITARSRLLLSPRQVVEEVNRYLRGWRWTSYFRYGNSAQAFRALYWFAAWRLKLWSGKRVRWRRRHRGQPFLPSPTVWGSSRFLDASLRHGRVGRGGECRMPPGEGHR